MFSCLQDALIDAVAMREVHFSMARKAAEAGDSDKLEEHLEAYAGVLGKDHFVDELKLIETQAVKAAQEKRNRAQERFVTRLCGSLEDSLNLFFSEEKRLAQAGRDRESCVLVLPLPRHSHPVSRSLVQIQEKKCF